MPLAETRTPGGILAAKERKERKAENPKSGIIGVTGFDRSNKPCEPTVRFVCAVPFMNLSPRVREPVNLR